MGTLGWIVVGIAFVGFHLVMQRGHSIMGGSEPRAHGGLGGCCGGGHDHPATGEVEGPSSQP